MAGLTANKVVVPIDFSDQSIAAIDTAIEIAGSSANVHVVHVLAELTPTEPAVVWNTIDDETRKAHVLTALKRLLEDARYGGLNMDIEVGDPGRKITEFAASIGANLIVTPSHGRTGLTRLLLGSVAERITRLAHCPVLVLRE